MSVIGSDAMKRDTALFIRDILAERNDFKQRLDAAEREREAFAERVFRHGFSDGWTANQKGRLAASASVDEAWHFYVADGALQKSVALTANHSAPVVEE